MVTVIVSDFTVLSSFFNEVSGLQVEIMVVLYAAYAYSDRGGYTTTTIHYKYQ